MDILTERLSCISTPTAAGQKPLGTNEWMAEYSI
jgi:hypothetical protein